MCLIFVAIALFSDPEMGAVVLGPFDTSAQAQVVEHEAWQLALGRLPEEGDLGIGFLVEPLLRPGHHESAGEC